jgi:glycyl-tRNA synthetase beta chain
VNFVRPAHKLVALHGADRGAGHGAGPERRPQTQGHRFEAAVSPVVLPTPTATPQHAGARQGAVIAGFAARRAEIARQLAAAAAAGEGLPPIEDDACSTR